MCVYGLTCDSCRDIAFVPLLFTQYGSERKCLGKKMKKIVIIGASGYDYHVFLQHYKVVAFTVAEEQNLGTAEGSSLRSFPPSLCGPRYPNGIPSIPESQLAQCIRENQVDECILAYSDVSYRNAMRKAALVLSSGAQFTMLPPGATQIAAVPVPLLAVTAIRTGCGKSQTATALMALMGERGLRAVAVREPMPYGDLQSQRAMRFSCMADLDRHGCSVEEREEYEQYVERGLIIYSGVDYRQILHRIMDEDKPDVILFDGGNNEVSFFKPDVMVTIADPLRPGEETNSFPGEVNARLADFLMINKENSADAAAIHQLEMQLRSLNPHATIIHADSVVTLDAEGVGAQQPDLLGKRVLVVEDGPTITHGDMSYGAGFIAARQHGAHIVCARNLANLPDSFISCFNAFPHIKEVLPALGYNDRQRADLIAVLRDADVDYIVAGTPFDLAALVGDCGKPIVRVRYSVQCKGGGASLDDVLDKLLTSRGDSQSKK